VQDLWGNPGLNSGGGLWDPPSFDSHGNLYLGIANPGPIGQTGWPKGYPWGTSRPGPDLYTDSVVKLSPQGKLLWYYQLTPHDLYDWDLQNSPVLTTANGQPVVIDGGKAGILMPARFDLEPGVFGGVESQLATNGSTTFAAVNNLAVPLSVKGVTESSKAFESSISKATGEMIAVNQDTGKIEWDDRLPSSPYGAATVTIDGDYVIVGASNVLSSGQRALIIAYKLGASGKLPDTVGS
jgi:alcohol dehydrogenase (cytochrome c)